MNHSDFIWRHICRIFLVILLKQSEVKRVPLHCNNATLMILKYKNYLLTLSYISIRLQWCVYNASSPHPLFSTPPQHPIPIPSLQSLYLPQVHPHNSTTYYLLNYPTTLIFSSSHPHLSSSLILSSLFKFFLKKIFKKRFNSFSIDSHHLL